MYETSEPTLFSVNSEGYVTVVKSDLDFEDPQQRSFSMQVTVRERNNPSQSASGVLSVRVLDINDNTPVFQQQGYTVSKDPSSIAQIVTTVS